MTSNQLAYQQNKLREQELAQKQRDLELKESQHLHEYGDIVRRDPLAPLARHKPSIFGTKKFEQVTSGLNKLVSPLIGVGKSH